MENQKQQLFAEKMELTNRRTKFLEECNPLKWGEGTPREIVELNARIEQINKEIERLKEHEY